MLCELVRKVLSQVSSCHEKSSQNKHQARDRDRATTAFWRCNWKLIETINMVLIIKAQVLRWHFADCFTVGSTYIHKECKFNLLFRKENAAGGKLGKVEKKCVIFYFRLRPWPSR